MTTQTKNTSNPGINLIVLAGIGLVGYGILFLYFNFTSLIELGLGETELGMTAEEIQSVSPQLYHYISHVQTGTAAFIIATGICVIALAWFGIRKGHDWAFWTVALSTILAFLIALPLHYVWGFSSIVHLGLPYLDILLLLSGLIMVYVQRSKTLSA
jgi:hypothetical protein